MNNTYIYIYSDSDAISCPSWGIASVLVNSEDDVKNRIPQACNVYEIRGVYNQEPNHNIDKEKPAYDKKDKDHL